MRVALNFSDLCRLYQELRNVNDEKISELRINGLWLIILQERYLILKQYLQDAVPCKMQEVNIYKGNLILTIVDSNGKNIQIAIRPSGESKLPQGIEDITLSIGVDQYIYAALRKLEEKNGWPF